MLDRNIDKTAQSSSFMDVFARRALFSQFMRPFAKFILENIEEEAGKIRESKKVAEVRPELHPSTSLFFKASTKFEKQRCEKKHRDVQIEEKKIPKQKHPKEGRKFSALSETSSLGALPSLTPSGTELFFTRMSWESTSHKEKLMEP